MNTVFRWRCLILVMLVVFVFEGCAHFGNTPNDSVVAKTTIKHFSDYSTMVKVVILVQPKKGVIIPGEAYSVVLMACDGYLFAHQEIGWVTSDFSHPKVGERNVGEISKAETRSLRTITLLAPGMDKSIFPMRQELAELRDQREAEEIKYLTRVWEGSASGADYNPSKYIITESDYQRIAEKYIKVVVMPYEEWLELKQESGQ